METIIKPKVTPVEAGFKINGRTREGKTISRALNEVGVETQIVNIATQYGSELGYHKVWDKDTVMDLANKINSYPTRNKIKAVAVEVIQPAWGGATSFVGYWTVGEDSEYKEVAFLGYYTDTEQTCELLSEDGQVTNLTHQLAKLIEEQKAQALHTQQIAEATANAVVSDHDKYQVRTAQRKLDSVTRELETPLTVDTSSHDLVERAENLVAKQLLELVIHSVGKPLCQVSFGRSSAQDSQYKIVTINDVLLYIATRWTGGSFSSSGMSQHEVAARNKVVEALRF
jgi:hypothetical protein